MIRKQRITTEKSRGIGMHIEGICYLFLLMAFAFDSKKKWEERWGHAKEDEEKGKYIKKSVLKHLFLYILFI